jgi:hypothetical protein
MKMGRFPDPRTRAGFIFYTVVGLALGFWWNGMAGALGRFT